MAARDYVIWGSAGHAKVLADMITRQGGRVVALVDNDRNAIAIDPNLTLLCGEQEFLAWLSQREPSRLQGLVAIGGGRGRDRMQLHELFRKAGLLTEPLLDTLASISPSARIGAGSQLLPQSLVAAGCVIGEACILNHKASLDHECMVGNGVHLAPGVTVCGCVTIGDNVFVGAGACILPRVRIGNDTVIGAGALVTRDVPDGVVVHGSPARIVRSNT